MLSAKVCAEEQFKLILECRQSGLTDQQWCLNHDIKPATFYNWVKRLRQRGGFEIPAHARRSYKGAPKQEVVRLEFNETPSSVMDISVPMYEPSYETQTPALPVMELSIGNKACLRISNGIDPILLAQTLKTVMESTC
jgi:transposase-like protein